MASRIAPGAPGILPTWTSSAKDMVCTSRGTSRVWVTLGFGIVNEVYWPNTAQPQIRDLGFIVAVPGGWHEVKRMARYRLALPQPFVPLPQVVHEGPGYTLTLSVVIDPARDVMLLDYRLEGDGARLYALLAPHLGGTGVGNSAFAGRTLAAHKADAALCLACDAGFARTSAGYVGVSDGWQDFSRNGAMTWTYDAAENGNVALMGELAAAAGVLALGLAHTPEGAQTLAQASLAERFAATCGRFTAGWERWAEPLEIPAAPPAIRDEAWLSAAMLAAHEDRHFPGAIVASLGIPWGNTSDSSGGYHLVWTRDAVEASLALFAVGHADGARRTLAYLAAVQRPDGSWPQNCFADGTPYWTAVQLDEVAFPVLLAAKLREENALAPLADLGAMVRRAIAFLVASGPISAQDRWEENAGISPFTIAVVIAALVAAAPFLTTDEAAFAAALADDWNERIEPWTYAEGGPLAERFGVQGHYVRIGPVPLAAGLRGRVQVSNRHGLAIDAAQLVGMEYLWLVRLGLRRADDPRVLDTLRVTDALLRADTPSGVAFYRYNEDGYGEHADGAPFDGSGVGRPWPLLAGERAHYELAAGRAPLDWLTTMTRMTGPGGLIPEQIWDSEPIPARGLVPGKPTGSAMPLVWAHAEFLKLLVAREQGRPVERLRAVEQRYAAPRAARAWHWRPDLPFAGLPAGRNLAIDLPRPFRLHAGFDGWQDVRDLPSAEAPFGRHVVELAHGALEGRRTVDFTLHFSDDDRWEGTDHHVALETQEEARRCAAEDAGAVTGTVDQRTITSSL
jgi:glucoamylase